MYNTEFIVKYNDIEQEILNKYSETKEYSVDDILDICDKLYQDELLSVFGAKDILDDKIDLGMKHIYTSLRTNTQFNQLIDELSEIGFKKMPDKNDNDKENIRKLLLFVLFSKDLFYITHKLVCQHIKTNIISDELLVELKTKSIDLLNRHQLLF